MLLETEYTAPPSVADVIGALGRTEDVRFSPSDRRLAVAAFHRNRIAVFDIDVTSSRRIALVALTGGVQLSSPALQWPHGVDFIDDDTLIVTSRRSDVAICGDMPSHEVLPAARWPADGTTLLNAPGSVAVTAVQCCRKVGESGRRSMITSWILPLVHRTTRASVCGGIWKCIPRTAPLR